LRHVTTASKCRPSSASACARQLTTWRTRVPSRATVRRPVYLSRGLAHGTQLVEIVRGKGKRIERILK
jgi:hypothetical protein